MDSKDKNAMMLIHDTSKAFKNIMRKKAEREGISDRYRMILLMLNLHNGCTQLDIVNWTKLTPPTISLTLQKMEEEQLIKRVVNEKDKRAVNIYLLDDGMKMIDRIIVLIKETEKIMFDGLSETEIKNMEGMLRKMLDNASSISLL